MHCAKRESTWAETVDVFEIQLEGEFDLSERERLTDALSLADRAQLIVVNLERTTYIDSTVLQCFMALYIAAGKRRAKLILLGVHGTVQRVFELTGLVKLFDIRDSFSDVLLKAAKVQRFIIEARTIR